MKNIVAANQQLEVYWYLRLANSVIDIITVMVLILLSAIIAALLTHVGIYGPNEWFADMRPGSERLIGAAYLYAYYAIMEITTQRTVGKYITGTMVIRRDGSKPAVGAILGRSLCRLFSIEALSFIRAVPRGWHDHASHTYVVHAKKLKELQSLKHALDEIGTATE